MKEWCFDKSCFINGYNLYAGNYLIHKATISDLSQILLIQNAHVTRDLSNSVRSSTVPERHQSADRQPTVPEIFPDPARLHEVVKPPGGLLNGRTGALVVAPGIMARGASAGGVGRRQRLRTDRHGEMKCSGRRRVQHTKRGRCGIWHMYAIVCNKNCQEICTLAFNLLAPSGLTRTMREGRGISPHD